MSNIQPSSPEVALTEAEIFAFSPVVDHFGDMASRHYSYAPDVRQGVTVDLLSRTAYDALHFPSAIQAVIKDGQPDNPEQQAYHAMYTLVRGHKALDRIPDSSVLDRALRANNAYEQARWAALRDTRAEGPYNSDWAKAIKLAVFLTRIAYVSASEQAKDESLAQSARLAALLDVDSANQS